MALALVVLALGCLLAAAFLWQRSKKAVEGVDFRGTRIATVVLIIAGVLLALASQLPVFKA